MMIKKLIATSVLTLFLLPSMSMAASDADKDARVGSNLPPKIRVLLIQEMVAVLDASQKIVDALVRGQDQIVAQQAQAIHDSFIMEQEMTEEDMATLVASVPEAFLKKDEAFHALGADLAKAGHEKDREKQVALFSQMMSSCVDCHSQHAQDRFPHFAP